MQRSNSIYKMPKDISPRTQRYLHELARTMRPDVVKYRTGMHYEEQSKYIAVQFDPKTYPDGVELVHITDVQFGNAQCQIERVLEYRDWVLAKPNRFMLWTGDMIDAGHAFSPGQGWDNILSPASQLFHFCALWAPARHRVLGYVGGNHERRSMPLLGADLGIFISMMLRIPYSDGRQLIDIHYGKHKPLTIDLWHGGGSSKTDGNKVMMISNYVRTHPGSDVYLCGHLHDCFVFQKHREVRLHHKCDVKIKKYYFGMSSSFLRTWGTYAEVKGLSVTDVAMLRLVLDKDGHYEVTIR